jgi:TolB-like protein/DNA-binding winged helix-turn-helix (wHTH) protein
LAQQYSFGRFKLDERERQLTREGQVVHLQPKSFDVLLFLLEHAGRLVEKNEVIDAVWKGTVVTENSLTVCIRQIRVALEDNAEAPEFIETIPTAGYRFIADVAQPDDAADATKQQAITSAQGKPTATSRWMRLAILLAVVAIAYFAFDRFVITPIEEEPMAEKGTSIEASFDSDQWENSIAVIPFVNISDDPGNEFFCDGLTEEILTLLAKIPELKVIGRTSSYAFKGINEDLREIGRKLGVKTLLEGSVRKSGQRVRITAQLIDASDGSHIWAESYDRSLIEIFEIQDDVASAIIEAMQLHVGAEPTRGRPTVSAEAYTLFLKAKLLLNVHDGIAASSLLEQAITLDPNFAAAHELQAFSYWTRGDGDLPAVEALALSREAAAAALAIDPDLPFAQALYLLPAGGSEARLEALDLLERAWRDNPFNSAPLHVLIYELEFAGYLQEAHRYAAQWVNREPITPMANYRLGETLFALGRIEEAQAPLAFAYDQGEEFALWFVPGINLTLGNDELAIAQLETLLERYGINDIAWVRDLLEGARDPTKSPAYVDRRIDEILASIPGEHHNFWRGMLEEQYLYLGFLDRYYETISAHGPNSERQNSADVDVWQGTVFRRTGFTAHPRYLEVAGLLGIPEIWEQRGPPDFCEKVESQWVCE